MHSTMAEYCPARQEESVHQFSGKGVQTSVIVFRHTAVVNATDTIVDHACDWTSTAEAPQCLLLFTTIKRKESATGASKLLFLIDTPLRLGTCC